MRDDPDESRAMVISMVETGKISGGHMRETYPATLAANVPVGYVVTPGV